MHADDPLARSSTQRAIDASGLTTERLRSAIHDLRGPLNTLSILLEILRGAAGDGAAQRDTLASARRALQQYDGMLQRLRNVSDAIAPRATTLPLQPLLGAAAARLPNGPVRLHVEPEAAADLAVLGCAERLPRVFDLLFACAAATLPDGGELRLGVRRESRWATVEVVANGPTIALPAAGAVARLTPDDPGSADWFALACLTAGVGAEFASVTAAGRASLMLRLPLPPPPTERNASC